MEDVVPTQPAIIQEGAAPQAPEVPHEALSKLADLVNDDGSIVLQNKSGELESIEPHEVHQALQSKEYTLANPDAVNHIRDQAKYGTVKEQLKTGAEGVLRGLTGTLSEPIEAKLFGNLKEQQKRQEVNPGISMGTEIGGLALSNLVPGFGEYADAQAAAKAASATARGAKAALRAGQLTEEMAAPLFAAEKAAQAAASHAVNPLSAQSVYSGLGERAATALGLENPTSRGAIRAATEMALMQTGNETSKMFENDPDQTLGTAAAHLGLAALIGAPIGGAVGKFGEMLDNSKIGQKLSQGITDFKSRWNEHITNPDPVKAISEELLPYTQINEEGLDVYGKSGLKAKAIEHLMPKEVSEPMISQAENLVGKARALSQNMENNPDLFPRYSSAGFNRDLRVLSEGLEKPDSPSSVFNAIQDFKQRIDDLLPKKGEIAGPADRAFINAGRDLRSSFKNALEDEEVWGKAAKVQTDINKAFTEYFPALKDFKAKFMSKVGGEHALDVGKLQTYINQTGKSGQAIKREMLGNFIDASENFRNAVNKTYEKLGSTESIAPQPLSFTKSTLNELTPGAKLADTVVKKGLAALVGKGAGAIAGGVAGNGFLGAILGEQILGPFIESILPGLAKPLLEKEASATGFHASAALGKSVLQGEGVIKRAVKNVFKAGSEVIPSHLIPSDKDKEKLDKLVTAYQENPEKIFDLGGPLNHYQPEHNAAIGTLASNVTQYLGSLRPNTVKANPLDQEPKPSAVEKSNYDLALTIAQQPMVTVKMVKDGTLTPDAVKHLTVLHPALKQRLDKMFMEEIVSAESKHEQIPYGRRLSLALFLGQPLDSTMTPQGLQTTQSSFMMGPTPSQQQKAPPKEDMSALSKSALADATPSQARERQKLK